jgi:hypothetical protein
VVQPHSVGGAVTAAEQGEARQAREACERVNAVRANAAEAEDFAARAAADAAWSVAIGNYLRHVDATYVLSLLDEVERLRKAEAVVRDWLGALETARRRQEGGYTAVGSIAKAREIEEHVRALLAAGAGEGSEP